MSKKTRTRGDVEYVSSQNVATVDGPSDEAHPPPVAEAQPSAVATPDPEVLPDPPVEVLGPEPQTDADAPQEPELKPEPEAEASAPDMHEAAPAETPVEVLRIRTRSVVSFWRAGLQFTREVREVPVSSLTTAQVVALRSEPRLKVEE